MTKTRSDETVLDALLTTGEVTGGPEPRPVLSGTATLSGFTPIGAPILTLLSTNSSKRVVGRTCVPLDESDLGRQVALLNDPAMPESPIVVGVVDDLRLRDAMSRLGSPPVLGVRDVEVDGKTITLTAQKSLTVRCGEASITLTCDGKIVIRGEHVVSHASGVNRIRGGSVQLN